MSVDARRSGNRLALTPRGRLVAAAVVAAIVVLVVAVLAFAGGGGGQASPPASAAARLVPADALVYVHLSTDADREHQ